MPRYLILHGLEGSGPDHWQSWVAERLPGAVFPDLPDPFAPRLKPWLDALRVALALTRPAPVVLCHSLAGVLWLHYAARRGPDDPGAGRVLLVAPPSAGAGVPEIADFFPVPVDPVGVRAAAGTTHLVCSDADPYCPEGAASLYAEPLGITSDVIPGGGHLNPDAGYGAWPALEAWARGERDSLG